MKKTLVSLLPICFLLGCATGPIIGPFSYMAVKSNEDNLTRRMNRQVLFSQNIPAETKPKIIEAVNMGSTPEEIAVGFQVNVTELLSTDYTTDEKLKTLVGQGLDTALYGWLISLATDDGGSDSVEAPKSESGVVIYTGDINAPTTIGVVDGDNNASNNDDNGTGESNHDADFTE